MQEQVRKRLLTINDPQQLRIYKELAAEIGFKESVVLLQIEYLIASNNNYRDGKYWTYQSLRELQEKHFPWWDHVTIGRVIQTLVKKNLLVVGNYNKLPLDKTPWYALNEEGISTLKSVKLMDMPMLQSETTLLQNATSSLQDETSALQIETTIPKNSSKNKKEEKKNIHVESDRLDGAVGSASPSKKEITATVQRIFDYWVEVRKKDRERTKLTTGRRVKVEARLKEGYTEEQIKLAIDGCNNSPHHCGQNDTGTIYDDLTLICRSGEKLEWFIQKAPAKKKPTQQPTQPAKPKKTYAEIKAAIDATEEREEQERKAGLRL